LSHHLQADIASVGLIPSPDLSDCAKDLFVGAKHPAPLGPRLNPRLVLAGRAARRPPLAAPNKCLALSNKPCAGGQATKKRENRAKRNDKRRASNRSDLPSGDVGLHRRCCGLRRDRVTTRAKSYPSRIM